MARANAAPLQPPLFVPGVAALPDEASWSLSDMAKSGVPGVPGVVGVLLRCISNE